MARKNETLQKETAIAVIGLILIGIVCPVVIMTNKIVYEQDFEDLSDQSAGYDIPANEADWSWVTDGRPDVTFTKQTKLGKTWGLFRDTVLSTAGQARLIFPYTFSGIPTGHALKFRYYHDLFTEEDFNLIADGADIPTASERWTWILTDPAVTFKADDEGGGDIVGDFVSTGGGAVRGTVTFPFIANTPTTPAAGSGYYIPFRIRANNAATTGGKIVIRDTASNQVIHVLMVGTELHTLGVFGTVDSTVIDLGDTDWHDVTVYLTTGTAANKHYFVIDGTMYDNSGAGYTHYTNVNWANACHDLILDTGAGFTVDFSIDDIQASWTIDGGNSFARIYVRDQAAGQNIWLTLNKGALYTSNNAGAAIAVTDGVNPVVFSPETEYTIEIIMNAANTHYFRINGALYNNSGSFYQNRNAWLSTDTCTYLYFHTYSASSISSFYIRQIELIEPNTGFSFYTFDQIEDATDSGEAFDHDFQPLYQSDGSVLGLKAGGDVVRVTGTTFGTWTSEIASAVAFFAVKDPSTDGTVYCCYNNDYASGISQYKKSTNFGDTWTNLDDLGANVAGDGSDNRYCIAMFSLSTSVYTIVVDAVASPGPQSLYVYLLSGTNWVLSGSVNIATTNAPLDMGGAMGFVGEYSGSSAYYFAAPYTTNTRTDLFVATPVPARLTTISTTYTLDVQILGVADLIQPFAMIVDESITFEQDNALGIAYISLKSGASYRMFYTTDGGNTWGSYTNDLYLRPIPHQFTGTGLNSRYWMVEANNYKLYYYDSNIHHFVKFNEPNLTSGYASPVPIVAGDVVFALASASTEEIWQYTEMEEIITGCVFELWGTEQPGRCWLNIHPDFINYFNKGDIISFEDGLGKLSGRYMLNEPQLMNRDDQGYIILATDMKFELLASLPALYESKTTKQILQSIIDLDQISYIYRSSSIDPNGDFTTAYTRKVSAPTVDFIKRWAREFENAIFYVEPDGKAWCLHRDQAVDTGLRFHQEHPQVLARDMGDSLGVDGPPYRDPSFQITKSRVTGAYHQGSTDTVEVYREYPAAIAQDTLQGIVVIERKDPQIRNDTEALQLATNRYTIFSQSTQFFDLTQIQAQGFIQPGQTIRFSWEDAANNLSIPRGNWFFMHGIYDAKNDIYRLMTLTNNIMTNEEFNRVRDTRQNEDSEIRATYSDGTTQSTTDGTIITLNPVGALQAGTFVWRNDTPGAPDFDEGDLTDDTNWNDLDLSSIIPAGKARSVLINVYFKSSFGGDAILFRKNGKSTPVTGCIVQVPQRADYRPIPVGVDGSGICEINVNRSPSNWTDIDITVLGWWL